MVQNANGLGSPIGCVNFSIAKPPEVWYGLDPQNVFEKYQKTLRRYEIVGWLVTSDISELI